MQVHRHLDALARGARAAWAIGNFDGVHVGHRHIVERLLHASERTGTEAWVLTFDPHPMAVLRPDQPLALLTSIDRRLELLEALGIAGVVVTAFDDDIARVSPEQFAHGFLRERLGACAVVVGADFRFGAGRAGDTTSLRALGATEGFELDAVRPVEADGAIVSSTRIRTLLAEGEVESAARLLGRSHDVTGRVVEGQRRGRTIGFPTANLGDVVEVLPRDGVYACRAKLDDGREIHAVANLGVRPTVAAGRAVEAHLLGFDGDLYGRRLRLAFVARIRDERRFADIDALRTQIAADVERATVLLSGAT